MLMLFYTMRLVNEELLQYATKAEIVFVGKRLGCHAYTQDQINELIVSMANRYGHVVRLKGGDPFIFGRGSEEIEYAEKFGLETSYCSWNFICFRGSGFGRN